MYTDYTEFLTDSPKLSEAAKAAMGADPTLEEIYNYVTTMKGSATVSVKIQYSVIDLSKIMHKVRFKVR